MGNCIQNNLISNSDFPISVSAVTVDKTTLQGAFVNLTSMLLTIVGGGAGTSWVANLSLNFVMGFQASTISFAIDMLRYYVWRREEEKERRGRVMAALAGAW